MKLLPALLLILPALFLYVSNDMEPLQFVTALHVKNDQQLSAQSCAFRHGARTTIRKARPEMSEYGTRPPSKDNVRTVIVKQGRNDVCLRSFQ